MLYIPLFIRGTIIKFIARKYNLSFQRNIGLKISTPKHHNINVCSGVLSGKEIKFFDYISYDLGVDVTIVPKSMRRFSSENDARLSFKRTKFVIDGDEYFVKNKFFSGNANVFRILKLIQELNNGSVDMSLLDKTSKPSKKFNIMLVFVFIIFAVGFYVYLTNNFL